MKQQWPQHWHQLVFPWSQVNFIKPLFKERNEIHWTLLQSLLSQQQNETRNTNSNIIQTPPHCNDPQKSSTCHVTKQESGKGVTDIAVGKICWVLIPLHRTALQNTSHLVHSFCAFAHFWKTLLMHLLVTMLH